MLLLLAEPSKCVVMRMRPMVSRGCPPTVHSSRKLACDSTSASGATWNTPLRARVMSSEAEADSEPTAARESATKLPVLMPPAGQDFSPCANWGTRPSPLLDWPLRRSSTTPPASARTSADE